MLRRGFALDVLACPPCGGRLRVLATVQDPAVVRAILTHLGVAPSPDSPDPAPPQLDYNAATGSPSPGGPAGLAEISRSTDGGDGRQGPPSASLTQHPAHSALSLTQHRSPGPVAVQ